MTACDRYQCPLAGDWLIQLNHPDGTDEWHSCWAHLVEFQAWVLSQDPDADWAFAYWEDVAQPKWLLAQYPWPV